MEEWEEREREGICEEARRKFGMEWEEWADEQENLRGQKRSSSGSRTLREGYCYGTLWTLTIFIFFLLFFLILYGFCFFFLFILDNEEACDMEVTWRITWYNDISLEHSRRVWKMTSGHMETTWWLWVGNEANMRMQYRHEGRFNYC